MPYFSRKGNYNVPRKLSLPVFRLHCNLDWPSNTAVCMIWCMLAHQYSAGLGGMCSVILPLICVDMGTYVKSGSNKEPHASWRLNLLLFLTQVTWWEFSLSCQLCEHGGLLSFSLSLEPLHHSCVKGCLKKLQDNKKRDISSVPVKLAYIGAWVWAEDLNAFPLSLNKVTYPITREIPNE